MEDSMMFPQIKNRTIIQSSNSISGHLSEENENTNLKRYTHPHVMKTLFTIAELWKNLNVHWWI